MNKVIRYNTDTGSFGVYEDAQSANHNGMPFYTTEQELAEGKASIPQLVRFYNSLAAEPVKSFKDKATAAKRVWAIVQSGEVPHEPSVEEPTEPSVEEPTEPSVEEPTEEQKKGRAKGTGKYAEKMIFPLMQSNPRRIGTSGFISYEIIREKPEGISFKEYREAGGVVRDLEWDVKHGWAKIV